MTRPSIGFDAANTLLACFAIALIAGCGTSALSTKAKTEEARFVAFANRVCRGLRNEMRATAMPLPAHTKTELRALAQSASKAPPISRYLADTSARRKLLTQMRSLSRTGGRAKGAFSLIDRAYQLEVDIQSDLKALGATNCIGRHPRKPISG
jgi:hypothetical protein